ncbi:Gfo/Idh/MocA family oxidoreductase [Brucella pseudogrignonensis]|uniref:Gfo/Idh/MocA family protein n=1 Tax=Brucella TaxID=234 RepID=UPI000CFC92A7|nr:MULTISPECIES: Gfo/Idh/MocA family oxidoreductase [Brucella]MBK0022325.1 Gfo/Idh/MocA family oxidoreductase [Ochrobactrum sp. S45]MBK0044340.1 Gfo/Idh/MocA family oxidoreductase [Ochrobactrum sp. S46]MBO1026101.1 Gfo/Idh/MocA family oxidoreductase [Ochrobactrum sp. SD129]MQP41991.1 gfo/Idh/MocA family oxidoreductase [Ochrobactrum sp. MYb237]MCD4509871.1 Gfo/Idh/MocA family oxidoreductase [Brucella pseudogrignonensis]
MKVGIVGLGYRLGYLGFVFNALDPDFQIVGYVDPAPAGMAELDEHGISAGKQYATPEELIANETFDLLMIGSPNHMHLDHIRVGLEAGLTVFTEKPIVSSIEQTYALAELLAKHGQERLLVGLVLRYAPMYRDLMQAKNDGLLGNIVSVEAAEHIYPYHGAFFMRDWRRYSKWSGSFLLEKCCHDLDLYNSVIGSRPERVASFGGRKTFIPENDPRREGINDMSLFHRKPTGWEGSDKVFDSDGDIIDYQVAIIEYANGVGMNFHTNLNAPDQFRRFAIFGTRGQAEGDFIRGYFDVHEVLNEKRTIHKEYATRTELSQHYGADEKMAEEVIAHVMNAGPLPVSPLDAMEAGILAMAMDEAREKRTVIDLRPVWDRFDAALQKV